MSELKQELQTDYPLIPMGKVSDEARMIAVAWHENATDWIGDKHKLASDIMNYARRSNKELEEALKQLVQLKDWKDKNGKDEHYVRLQPVAWEDARKALAKLGK